MRDVHAEGGGVRRNGFIEGEAPRKAKDAREKTSGLVDLGLINDERRLTDGRRSQ